MCGGGPPPGTSCDSTALRTPPVSRPWMRMTIGMPRTFIFLPPSDGIWIAFINIGSDVLLFCAGWQDRIMDGPVFFQIGMNLVRSYRPPRRTKSCLGQIPGTPSTDAECARPRAQQHTEGATLTFGRYAWNHQL